MYTYAEQRELVENIPVKEGGGINIDCVFCGGRKTLGLTIKDGKKLWHCFKVSCGAKGSVNVGMSSAALRRRVYGLDAPKVSKPVLPIPDRTSQPDNHPAVMRYLEENNCLEAYHNGLIRIEYAPSDNRVLFFTEDGKGAVGRSISKQLPKWKQYGTVEGIMKVGNGTTGVVVEDIASACSISRFSFCSGCALLGTVLSSLQKRQLMQFKEIIVALDKDASRKAISLASRLEGRIKARVLLLEKDLKHCTPDEIQRLLS